MKAIACIMQCALCSQLRALLKEENEEVDGITDSAGGSGLSAQERRELMQVCLLLFFCCILLCCRFEGLLSFAADLSNAITGANRNLSSASAVDALICTFFICHLLYKHSSL